MNQRRRYTGSSNSRHNVHSRDPLKRTKKLLDKFKFNLDFVKKWNLKTWEIFIIIFVSVFAYYAYYHHDNLHFHVLRTYAWAGYDEAQHRVAEHYVKGKGVEQDTKKAMEYFRLAADQGHAKASHNLALGHVMRQVKLDKGEPRRLLNHASANGVREADIVLEKYCDGKGMCSDD